MRAPKLILFVLFLLIFSLLSGLSTRVNKDNQVMMAAPLDVPENLATDDANDIAPGGGYLFWTTPPDEFCTHTGTVKSLNLSTMGQHTIYSGTSPNCYHPYNIVADDTYVYFTDWFDDHIKRLPLAGGTAVVLATGNQLLLHRALAQDGTHIYFGDEDGIKRVPKTGGVVTTLATGDDSNDSIELAVDDSYVYWSEYNALTNDAIRRVPKAGGAAQTVATGTAVDNPWAIAVDNTHVYWLEAGNSAVGRVPKAGGTATNLVPAQGTYVGGDIALNATDVYWTDTTSTATGRTRRISKSGGAIDDLVLGQMGPGSVNLSASYVYWRNVDGIWRLPLDAGTVAVDLTIEDMEITQAIQNLANDVPLVADKSTFVRVYPGVDIADTPGVTAVLHGTRAGSPLPGSPLSPVVPTVFVHQSGYHRETLNQSFNFWVPISWRSGSVTFRAEINPGAVIPESDHDNNSLSLTRTFNHKDPLCVDMVRVRTSSTTASVEDAGFWEIVGYLEAVYPVPEVRIYRGGMIEEVQTCWWGPFPYPCGGPYEMPDDGDKVLTRLWFYNLFTDDPGECNNDANYFGMVHPSEVSWWGQGYLPGDEAWGVMSVDANVLGAPMPNWFIPAGGPILAHELGHNYNRRHVDCPAGVPANVDPAYPYNACDMAPNNPAGYFGFSAQEMAVIQPTEAADMMTYSHHLPKPYWISDYTYRALYNNLPSLASPSPHALEMASLTEVLAITGLITPTQGTAVLGTAYRLETGTLVKAEKISRLAESFAESPNWDYTLRLLDVSNNVLFEQPFDLPDNGDPATEARSFRGIMGYHPDAVRIVLLKGSTILAARDISPNPPAVTILSPNGGESYSGSMTIEWQAADPDDDDLLYTVQYSADSGVTWHTITADYYTKTLVVDMASIPGSNTALIRVIATDGVNTGFDTSDGVFQISDKAPAVYIHTPTEVTAYFSDVQILLMGSALDAEDGMLDGSALRWYVDGSPVANGTGREAMVEGLATGWHTITLTAEDSANHESSASVLILVGDERVYMPILIR